jgi:hypothetical protein
MNISLAQESQIAEISILMKKLDIQSFQFSGEEKSRNS